MIGRSQRMNSLQPAELGDQLGAGREEQVEGVAEDQLVAERGDVARLERLDRAPGRQRHERRRLHLAVRELERPRARERIRRAGPDREHASGPVLPVELEADASVSVPSIVFGSPPPTVIATLRGLRSSGFGIRTSSTPLSKLALIASASTPSGSVSERRERAGARSTR